MLKICDYWTVFGTNTHLWGFKVKYENICAKNFEIWYRIA